MGNRETIDRRRIEDISQESERSWLGKPQGAQSVVVQTATKTTYPVVAGAYYWCEIMQVAGTPAEGATVTYSGTGQHLYAYNLGATVPPAGTKKLATQANGRWFIRHG